MQEKLSQIRLDAIQALESISDFAFDGSGCTGRSS